MGFGKDGGEGRFSMSPDQGRDTLTQRVTAMVEELARSRPHHWVRWMQIAGDRSQLIAGLVKQAQDTGIDPEKMYIHHFNTEFEKLPEVVDFDGALRRRIEEDLHDIEEDEPDFDKLVAEAGGKEALIESLLHMAQQKAPEDPREIYVTVPNQKQDKGWGMIRGEELSNDDFVTDPAVVESLRQSVSSLDMRQARSEVHERLAMGSYTSSMLERALAVEFKIDRDVVRKALPVLSREDVSFTCREPQGGLRDSVDIVIQSGTASNRFIESIVNVRKDGDQLVVAAVEQKDIPQG